MMILIPKKFNYLIPYILFILLFVLIFIIKKKYNNELFTDSKLELTFNIKENRSFPFRYFTDGNNNPLPFVAVTAFFRGNDAKQKYYDYIKKGMHVFGITAYKSFPNKHMLDISEAKYEKEDDFDYTKNIKNWLCCFKNKEKYGFTDYNNIIDISESDFYNAEAEINTEKKYDFIYICNKDSDTCPLNGWNAFNRNFDLALKCFPVMINDFKLKGLILGRENCGLEKKYGDKIEVSGWLDWHVLQEKMRQSKILFVPNIYDASPRVIAECLTKNLPVLMNENILCGFKYINHETGEFFTNENNIVPALTKLLDRMNTINPRKWWLENYSQEISHKKLRNFLAEAFKGSLDNIDQVKFIL